MDLGVCFYISACGVDVMQSGSISGESNSNLFSLIILFTGFILGGVFLMSEAAVVSKVFYIFLIICFSTGFALICFADLRPAPIGKVIQFRAKAYHHNWPLRTGLLVLLVLITPLALFAVFKENHRLNIVLALLIFLLFIIDVSIAIKILTWRNEQSTVVNKQLDGNSMLQQYGVDPEVTKIMDYVQSSYSCCGVTDYRDWATSAWAAQVQKSNAAPQSCCKIPAPGCGDELDIKDPFENIFVQGCTQLLYFSKTSDFIHGGVGMAVLFLHCCALIGCILLSCAMTIARGLTPIEALKGEQPDQKPEGLGKKSDSAGGKAGSGKSHKKPPKTKDGTKKFSGDDLDFEEENKPPKGARNMLIDKSELENRRPESEMSETLDTS